MALKNFKTLSFQALRDVFLQNRIKVKLILIPFEKKDYHWKDEGEVTHFSPGHIAETFCKNINDAFNSLSKIRTFR